MPTRRLSSAERARLRSTVDVEALERFFEATPQGFHRFFFLACVVDLSGEERRSLGEQIADLPPARRHSALGRLLQSKLESLWLEVDPPTSSKRSDV